MSASSYSGFLRAKAPVPLAYGREPDPIAEVFWPFQASIVRWGIRRGRAAFFMNTGTGKTICQLEWLRQSGRRGLIVAPLAVGEQTIDEAKSMLDLEVRKVAKPSGQEGIEITNFEKLEHFIGGPYDAIVIDESSRLKSLDGKQRTLLINEFTHIPRRLCCTATPAPNDVVELANHAEFLGIMTRREMLATFFTHDSERSAATGWRLKGHAEEAFWRWLAKWAVYLRRPSDLGFDDGPLELPPLSIRDEVVKTGWKPAGMLFGGITSGGLSERREARKETLEARVRRAAEIVGGSRDQWLIWCGLNAEGDAMEAALGEAAVQISGDDSDEEKVRKAEEWRTGKVRVLVTKPAIFGWGLNWAHCHEMLFLGLSDSWEAYYQSIRRCWRYGQKSPVNVVVVVSDAEAAVTENIRRKEDEAARMAESVVSASRLVMAAELGEAEAERMDYRPQAPMRLPAWMESR